jgi:ferrochelatase
MAYGAPDRVEDVAPFLLDVRGGRATPAELVDEVAGRYRAIGGGSPLLGVTRAQASALQARLAGAAGPDPSDRAAGAARVAVGMRPWRPWIAEALVKLAAGGCRTLVAIPLAPHVSRMSVGAYVDVLDRALRDLNRGQSAEPFDAVHRVLGFHDHPLFLDALADRVLSALGRWSTEGAGTEGLEVLFTAHSLPASILADGDPYPEQLAATARLVAARVAERLAIPAGERPFPWRLCYQSAGARPVPWLGPPIDEVLDELAAAGRRRVLAVPIGFVSDHVEVLFDLDLEARSRAAALGLDFARTESLNTSPRFIDALADLVATAVARGG